MANIFVQPGTKFTVTDVGTYVVGDTSDMEVGVVTLHLVDGGSFSGSCAPQARTRVPQAQTGTLPLAPTGGGSTLDDVAFADIAYRDTATGLIATAAITSLPSLIDINATGKVIALDVTDLSAGSIIVYVTRTLGALSP